MITKEQLRGVIASQRENLDHMDKGIPREKKIDIYPSFATIITGIRRCGKSTFLNQIISKQKKAYYLNLEDPRLEGFEISDFNKFEELMYELYGKGGIFFFDEIQTIDRWEKFVRYLTDKKEKVLITGSNASILSKEMGTKLTGRYFQKEIFPFSFNEFAILKNRIFEDYLYKGGFPEYLKHENSEILQNLMKDIILKDVVVRYGIKNSSILTRMAVYMISNVSKEFTYNSLKKILQIRSTQSVIDYMSYLEDTYLLFTVPQFDYSYKRQLVLPKKVYSIDNGLSRANSASFSKDKGRMLENLVFLHLRKNQKNIFYHKEEGECDFLIRMNEKITEAIQVCFKLDEENKDREIKGLLEALNKFKLGKGTIITYNQRDSFEIKGKRIDLIPCHEFL